MTPGQIQALVFYPRKDDGTLRVPPPAQKPQIPKTLDRDLKALKRMRKFLKPGRYESALAELQERWKTGEYVSRGDRPATTGP